MSLLTEKPLILCAAILVVVLAGCRSSEPRGLTKLSATDQTAAELAMAQAADANGLQAVLVHIKLSGLTGTLKEREQIQKLEKQLDQILKQNRFDESDGDEIADGECVIYLYAYDADALYSCVQPALESCSLRKEIHAVKRYGPPGSRESKVEIPQPVQQPVPLEQQGLPSPSSIEADSPKI